MEKKVKKSAKVSQIVNGKDLETLLNQYRRKSKLTKPKKPNYTKKPKAGASVATINKWIQTNQVKKAYYEMELKAYEMVKAEKEKAKEAVNQVSLQLRY